MEELLKYLGFTTPFMYAAAAYALFHWLDENASDEAKASLARTMRFKDYKKEQVASALVEVFDRIYTYPLLRWRAFFRSLLFTTAVSAIFVFELYRYAEFSGPWRFILLGTLIALLTNVLTDYLSLFVIRPVLIRSGTKPVISLVLGAVSGAAIVLAPHLLRVAFLPVPSVDFFLRPVTVQLYVLYRAYLIFVWPATAVFAWLPLFALGIVTARLLTPMTWIVGRTQWFLKEGKEHPFKAIGYVAAIVVFLGTVAWRAVFSA
jgi:hypothetical protein